MPQSNAELFPQRRSYFLKTLQTKIREHPHIKAAWLEGSLGRKRADRYSDLDIHVLLAETDHGAFNEQIQDWLYGIEPLVLFNLLFNGHMVNALTESGVRIDLWLHSGESISLDPARSIDLLRKCAATVGE